MKRSRPSRPYVPVPKLRIKAAKKQHDNGETYEYNVVEDSSKCDDVAETLKSDNVLEDTPERDDVIEDAPETDIMEEAMKSDDVLEEMSESDDVAEDAPECDDVAEEASERDDVAEDTSERSSERQNEVCINAELSRISLNGYEN